MMDNDFTGRTREIFELLSKDSTHGEKQIALSEQLFIVFAAQFVRLRQIVAPERSDQPAVNHTRALQLNQLASQRPVLAVDDVVRSIFRFATSDLQQPLSIEPKD